MFTHLPKELLLDVDLDLHRWATLVTDITMYEVENICYNRCSQPDITDTKYFPGRINTSNPNGSKKRADLHRHRISAAGLALLDISGSEVTDAGLKAVTEASPGMLQLKLNDCKCLSDVGIRYAAMSCAKLKILELKGCAQINGSGLEAVGNCCKELVELDLSECTSLKEWSLRQIAGHCKELRVLKMRKVGAVSDDTLKNIAQYASKLKEVDLHDCTRVTDSGIIAFSYCCGEVENLNLSRSQLADKITDSSMLALGQQCKNLEKLNIRGCYKLTNVGMNYLADGCTTLNSLDLGGCILIGNQGLEVLARRCPLLETLSISELKLVSNGGLRHLSMCKNLKHLNAPGLFKITNQKPVSFAPDGIAALAGGCLGLDFVNFSGSYQLGGPAVLCLATNCRLLTHINFSRCPKITPSALHELLKTCSLLKSAVLRGCEKISNSSLEMFGRLSERLQHLDVSQCLDIADFGIKKLVKGCPKLMKLVLKGCNKVTDISVSYMLEANLKLVYLDMSQCPRITETSLSWLANQCPSLFTLNVKDCKVSVSGIKAVMSSWSHTQLLKNDVFLGVVPAHAGKDLRYMDMYGDSFKMVVRIQSMFRCWKARQRRREQKKWRIAKWVILRLQCHWRRQMATRKVTSLRKYLHKINNAALAIQCCRRVYLAKQSVLREKAFVFLQLQEKCARRIQASWRGGKVRRVMRKVLRDHHERQVKRNKASRVIQHFFEHLLARRKFNILKAARDALNAKMNRVATKIQCCVRCWLAGRRVEARKLYLATSHQLRVSSAILIQALARGIHGRRVAQRRRYYVTEQHEAALTIQSAWRGRNGRAFFILQRKALQLAAWDRAALRIQTCFRARKGRLAGHLLLQARLRIHKEREAAVRKIQRIMLGGLARKRARELRKKRDDEIAKRLGFLTYAATSIQRTWRGLLGRRYAREIKRQHMRRWKEIWDEEKKRPFYFDQLSGEVRWRKPQELLQLMPRPFCDNCGEEALLECANCVEFYCEGCWEKIHSGGKRKHHQMRSLYDAYDRRVDYGDYEGDGESNNFPNFWPAEIEASDMAGWFLGAPKPPVKGSDSDLTGQKIARSTKLPFEWVKNCEADGNPYYWHKKTGISTFERPSGFVTPRHKRFSTPKQKWIHYRDDAVDLYYNPLSGETSYTRPPEFKSPREEHELNEDFGGVVEKGGELSFEAIVDPRKLNNTLNETTALPKGFETLRVAEAISDGFKDLQTDQYPQYENNEALQYIEGENNQQQLEGYDDIEYNQQEEYQPEYQNDTEYYQQQECDQQQEYQEYQNDTEYYQQQEYQSEEYQNGTEYEQHQPEEQNDVEYNQQEEYQNGIEQDEGYQNNVKDNQQEYQQEEYQNDTENNQQDEISDNESITEPPIRKDDDGDTVNPFLEEDDEEEEC